MKIWLRSAPLLALVLSILGWQFLSSSAAKQEAAKRSVAAMATDQVSAAFERVAETIRDSVVRIEAVRRVEPDTRRTPSPFFDRPFRDFFGEDFFEQYGIPELPQRPYVQEGQGSGFVISSDGYILTNNHLVQGADEVDVHFVDATTLRAKIAGTDPKTDIAIIKVDASGLKSVRFGDSDQLRPGQWVIAAGNPFGLTSTITAGIVSAIGRANVGLAEFEDFIQTDAAINPGNSGGPLVNLEAEVVGVNTAIYTRTGSYMGIGFAIPINMVKSIREDLIREGSVTRGMLGVIIQNLDEGLARSFGFEGTNGVLVSEVIEGGPGERAGLRAGDIIVSFDGAPMRGRDELRFRVAETAPGAKVSIGIVREGESMQLSVVIGELSPIEASIRTPPDRSERDLGIEVAVLNPSLTARLGLPDGLQGVVISKVQPASVAARAGMRPGEVITEVGSRSISTVGEFRELLGKRDLSEGVRMTIQTPRGRRYVFLRAR